MNNAELADSGAVPSPEARGAAETSSAAETRNVEVIGVRFFTPATQRAIREVQKGMAGVAEELGIRSEDDVMELVREVRHGERA